MHYDIFSVGAPEVRRNCFNRTVTGDTSVLALLGELVGREWPGIRFVKKNNEQISLMVWRK